VSLNVPAGGTMQCTLTYDKAVSWRRVDLEGPVCLRYGHMG